MAPDERTNEKEISPFLTEEIDARNFICYKYGRTELFNLDDGSSFLIEPEKYHQLKVDLYHAGLFEIKINIETKFESEEDGEIEWVIFLKGEELHREIVDLKEKNTVSFSFEPIEPFFDLSQTGITDLKAVAHTIVSVELKHNKPLIKNTDLNTEIFYIDKVILNEGDSVSFGTLANVIKNTGSTRLEYTPSHPIATRELLFLEGKPEVMFYYLREESRFK